MVLKQRDVECQALSHNTHILYRWWNYGPRDCRIYQASLLINQTTIKTVYRADWKRFFHYHWWMSFTCPGKGISGPSRVIEEMLKMHSCGPKQPRCFHTSVQASHDLGNAKWVTNPFCSSGRSLGLRFIICWDFYFPFITLLWVKWSCSRRTETSGHSTLTHFFAPTISP